MQPDDNWLKDLNKSEIPAPRPDRRGETLAAAQRIFVQEQFKSTQERTGLGRLLGRSGQHALTLFREMDMTRKNLLRGTALASVVALAAFGAFSFYSNDPYMARLEKIESASASRGPGASAQMTEAFENTKSNTTGGGQLSGIISNTSNNTISMGGIAESVESIFSSDSNSKVDAEARRDESAVPTPMLNAAPASKAGPLNQIEINPSQSVPRPYSSGVMPAAPVENGLSNDQQLALQALPPEYRQRATESLMQSKSVYDGSDFASGDRFAANPDQPMTDVAQAPVSTFSSDVDTASYTVARRMLRAGQLPNPDSVRTEEMVNYFRYNYPRAESRDNPFVPFVSVYPTPWNQQTRILHVGISGYDLPAAERKPVNLVFLIDVSGSMSSEDKLPLAKTALSQMVDKLLPMDTVSIVTYAGADAVVLPPTSLDDKERVDQAIISLGAGGGTAGAAGLRTAYDLARQNFNKAGVNRVILATDGDFNIGISEPGEMGRFVAEQRESGVMLSVLGFGAGNYNDTLMQQLAQNGNGVAAYIDNINEAKKVLGEQINGTLFTIAKDVKFQVEFNPAEVKSYRLLGYETRQLRREDFNNDKVDAGDVGAGMQVTALYEITPAVNEDGPPTTDGLRYRSPAPVTAAEPAVRDSNQPPELAMLRIRYKQPESNTSQLIEQPIYINEGVNALDKAAPDVRFAAAVAGFSRLLRHSDGMNGFGFADVLRLADGARGDADESRTEFLELVRHAQALSANQPINSRAPEEGGVAFPVPGQQ